MKRDRENKNGRKEKGGKACIGKARKTRQQETQKKQEGMEKNVFEQTNKSNKL